MCIVLRSFTANLCFSYDLFPYFYSRFTKEVEDNITVKIWETCWLLTMCQVVLYIHAFISWSSWQSCDENRVLFSFSDNSSSEKLNNLPKVTQLVGSCQYSNISVPKNNAHVLSLIVPEKECLIQQTHWFPKSSAFQIVTLFLSHFLSNLTYFKFSFFSANLHSPKTFKKVLRDFTMTVLQVFSRTVKARGMKYVSTPSPA